MRLSPRSQISGASRRRMSELGQKAKYSLRADVSALPPKADSSQTSRHVRKVPTAEVRRFTQSLRQRAPAATVAPYDRVGLAVRYAVVLSIPRHDQRWRFLSTSSARSAFTVITNSLLITSSTVRSVSITNVTRCRGIIGIHPLTPNWRATGMCSRADIVTDDVQSRARPAKRRLIRPPID
jgi:hypothetical protein